MGELLEDAVRVTRSDAELARAPHEILEEAGVSPWIELPIWLPQDPEHGGMHDANVSAAYDAGLTCRPSRETVADTWAWLKAEGDPAPRPDRPRHGLDPAKERRLLGRLA